MRYRLRYTFLLLGIGATLAIGWPVGAQGLSSRPSGFTWRLSVRSRSRMWGNRWRCQ